MTTRTLIGMAALLISATAATAAPTPTATTYVAKAGAGDLFETQSSKLVLATTKNSGIKDFANKMIADHADSTTQVKAAAKASGITPKPPMLNAAQKAMIAKLTAAHGTARDALYVSEQKMSHEQALELHQGYSQDGDKPALKDTAAKIVPVVQHHIQMLDAIPAA